MKSPIKTTPRIFAVFTLALAISSFAVARPTAPVDARTTEANVARITTSLLAQSQLSHHPLDAQLAGKLLDRYLDALDGTRSLFLKSDVAEFGAMRATLAQSTRADGDTRPAHVIFARYVERLKQKVAFDTALLKAGGFTFTGHDTFAFDREHAERPADLAAAHEIWKQALRAEVLQERLAEKPVPDVAATLIHRHEQQLKTVSSLGDDEVLEIYLDALAHVYDPHSDYMGKESMESLSIAMNLSLFGIGATLANEDGVCTIHELVPGGPAALSGELKAGDRIVAVAQATGATVDVTAMPLTRIVQLIRGPKGTPVTLTILPPVGAPGGARTVRLIRAEVQLADQQAKARIIDLPQPNTTPLRVGVIDLPSFYSGKDDRGGTGATADVGRLLDKLKAEQVRGVVLDLRRNGGGSLQEAIDMTGLFIKKGPVVQTRDSSGSVEVGADRDPSVRWAGPLVVLTSRLSASASEILAGALQDYGRAVIVGDTATFGKGTVQTIVPLASIMDRAGLGHSFDPGALKLTISKFYRPSGASTELRGVASDLVIPSPTEAAPVGESKLVDPLPWDTIPAASFDRLAEVTAQLQALRTSSAQRLATDPGFANLKRQIDRLRARLGSGTVSLNEAERRREQVEDKRLDDAIAAQVRRQTDGLPVYEITVKDVDRPGLPARVVAPKPAPAAAAGASRGPRHDLDDDVTEHHPADQLVLHEALHVLADYVRLKTPGSTRT
ncbi:MAG TPA: carboxy terminal-processing peptidase [Polyangia bacterium]|nr:carboxy terminal-processing peptidase [Polyangia bacterium]